MAASVGDGVDIRPLIKRNAHAYLKKNKKKASGFKDKTPR